jgi:hypothetical protein
MGVTIFLALNGLGVVFLLYVLANFWREGHQPGCNSSIYAPEFGERDFRFAVALTHPISQHSAASARSVIPFEGRNPKIGGQINGKPTDRKAIEILARRISTR